MVFCNLKHCIDILDDFKCHNPYFNRWFSAIWEIKSSMKKGFCHNPYFNRWFSAIRHRWLPSNDEVIVTILILIDGFLQYSIIFLILKATYSHNPYFNRWFSAIKICIFCRKTNLGHNPYFNRWFSAI